jgi:hypothetical protein
VKNTNRNRPLPDPLREASASEMPGRLSTQNTRRLERRWVLVNTCSAWLFLASLALTGSGFALLAALLLGLPSRGPISSDTSGGLMLAGLVAMCGCVALLAWRNSIMARIGRETSDPLARFFRRKS